MKIETIAVHGGYSPDPTTKAAAVPIYQTTSYAFDDTQHGADLFDLKVEGQHLHPHHEPDQRGAGAARGGAGRRHRRAGSWPRAWRRSPTRSRPSRRPATTSSRSSQLYGGTYNLFAHTFPQFGIEVRFADYRDPDSFRQAHRRAHQGHLLRVDRQPLGQRHRHRPSGRRSRTRPVVPLIVDNTVASPYLCRPFEHGADIVVHALTKYLGGHGNSLGGAIVDSGKFPWAEHKARFRRLNEPDVSYHGVVYTEALGAAAFIGRARVVPLRNTGAALSPLNAFLILQGIETLALRMDRICANTLTVAKYLQQHDKVAWVNYAGLPDHADHGLVRKYMGGHASGILSFGVKGEGDTGGIEAGSRFQDALKLILRLVNIGDAKSLACHPASTTHRQLSPAEMAKAGVTPDMVRLSIGIEHIDDIIADIEQALAAVSASLVGIVGRAWFHARPSMLPSTPFMLWLMKCAFAADRRPLPTSRSIPRRNLRARR
jgi:O-acetylhomoserine (thiol)-lyase